MNNINTKHFTNFEYLVRSDFLLKNKREVIVLFSYQGIHHIKLSLFINKVEGRNDEYYINEAKKIINQKIKDGSLEKYCEEFVNKEKKKKVLAFAVPLLCIGVVAGASVGTYFVLKPALQEVKVDVPETNGLVFSNQKAYVGQDYDTNISVNKTLTDLLLPDTLKTVTSGNRIVLPTEYTYTVSDNKETGLLHIPGEYIEGDVTIELVLVEPTPPEPTVWYLDNDYLNGLTKDDVTKEGGEIQTLKVNGLDHKVRLIGVDEDYGTIGDESTKIHTTWEFVNLISDKDGYSLATQWNDTDDASTASHNYGLSTINRALNGENVNNVLWAQKGATAWSNDYKCSVLDMLKVGNPGLIDALKAPSKIVSIYNDSNQDFEEQSIVCGKLFLPAAKELGFTDSEYMETTVDTYSFYKGHTDWDEIIRNKKQVNGTVIETDDTTIEFNPDSGQNYQGNVFNYAGYNDSDDEEGGGYCWLRSPFKDTADDDNEAWSLTSGGMMSAAYFVQWHVFAVAPVFCI